MMTVRTSIVPALLAVIALTTSSCSKKVAAPAVDADLILRNAMILTLDAAHPQAEALAMSEGRLLRVGTDDQVMRHQGPATTVIDLGQRVIMPGFVDAHTHLFSNTADLHAPQDTLLAYGITSVGNLGNEGALNTLQAFEAAGELKVRVAVYLSINNNCNDLLGEWFLNYPVDRTPGKRLWINGVKLFNDGGTCEKPTANSQSIYVEYEMAGAEALFWNQSDLEGWLQLAHGAGYQIAIHGIGDLAVELALDALETVLDGGANNLRHRIEHNTRIRDDMIGRYGELGIIPVVFGSHGGMCGFTDERSEFGQRVERRWKDLIAANPGLPVVWHGDDPPVPPVNPMWDLQHYVARTRPDGVGGDCMPPAWYLAQAVSLQQALKMMTINAAYALFREGETGSLEEGKLADLILLDRDPRTTSPDDLADIRVLATMIGGEVLYGSLAGPERVVK